MKRVLEKTEFDGIQEPLKTLYKENDGKYVLELEDYQEPQELLDAKRRETAEAKRLKAENEALINKQKNADKLAEQAKEKAIKEEQDRAKDVFTKLHERIEKMDNDAKAKEENYKKKAEKATLKNGVAELKTLFLDSEQDIIEPFLEKNLSIEYVDGDPVYAYIDDLGNKVTKLSEIKKILFANEKLKNRIKGVESSGGGASGTIPRPRAVPIITDLNKANEQDMLDLAASDPEAFKALVKKQKSQK